MVVFKEFTLPNIHLCLTYLFHLFNHWVQKLLIDPLRVLCDKNRNRQLQDVWLQWSAKPRMEHCKFCWYYGINNPFANNTTATKAASSFTDQHPCSPETSPKNHTAKTLHHQQQRRIANQEIQNQVQFIHHNNFSLICTFRVLYDWLLCS